MLVILDYDGTLTEEEAQAETLAELSLRSLSTEILHIPYEEIKLAYEAAAHTLLASPQNYAWEVNGLPASYCNEGAFILNTSILQEMLKANPDYLAAVARRFARSEYPAVEACTNHLFHRHSAEIQARFRPSARAALQGLLDIPGAEPVILTNSMGDKVKDQLSWLGLDREIKILGDTRQYDMRPDWDMTFEHPDLGSIQVWPLPGNYQIDLRRPKYHQALLAAREQDPDIVVVADTLSLPGAMPLMMGIPFVLVLTPYTPGWCQQVVANHPMGFVIDELLQLLDLDIIRVNAHRNEVSTGVEGN